MITDAHAISFIYNLRDTYAQYMDRLARRERIGRTELTKYKFKAFLLSAYIRILVEYFDNEDTIEPLGYAVNNFFDTSEIYDCLQHFNNLAESNIYLDFNE